MVRALEQAQEIVTRNWPKGNGWKVLIVIGMVVFGIFGIIIGTIWLLGQLVKSITAGGFRNKELYLPRTGRNLYIPPRKR